MATTGNWVPTGNDVPRLQGALRGAIIQLAASAATLQMLANILAQMAPTPDTTTIEQYFGLQPGEGQTLKDVVGGVNADLQGGNIQALLQRFG